MSSDVVAVDDQVALETAAQQFVRKAFWMNDALFDERLKMFLGALFADATRHGHSVEAALGFCTVYTTAAQAEWRCLGMRAPQTRICQ